MHILFLHSTGGNPDEAFFPWSRHELERLGHKVSIPDFPNSMEPNPEIAIPLVLEAFDPDEKTVLIGRSSGGTLIPHILQQEGIQVALAVSVAAPFDDLGWDNLQQLFKRTPNFGEAKASCQQYYHWYSDDDPYVPLEHAKHFQELLGGEIRVFQGYSHFYNETFPELLELIKNLS